MSGLMSDPTANWTSLATTDFGDLFKEAIRCKEVERS